MNFECPECMVLIDVSNVGLYELVDCWNCGAVLERLSDRLILGGAPIDVSVEQLFKWGGGDDGSA